MSRRVWKAVEIKAEEVRIAKVEGGKERKRKRVEEWKI